MLLCYRSPIHLGALCVHTHVQICSLTAAFVFFDKAFHRGSSVLKERREKAESEM